MKNDIFTQYDYTVRVLTMNKTTMFLLVVLAALVVAGCTTASPSASPTTTSPGGSVPTTSTATGKEISWPVQSSHESGPGSVSGTITKYAGGPAANYALYIWADSADPDKDPAFLMVRTDANGKYTISNIPNGYYSPRIPAPDGSHYSEPAQIHVEGATTWDESV